MLVTVANGEIVRFQMLEDSFAVSHGTRLTGVFCGFRRTLPS
jgi:hypothetical protein